MFDPLTPKPPPHGVDPLHVRRRSFLRVSGALAASGVASAVAASAPPRAKEPEPLGLWQDFPRGNPEWARGIVAASHGNIERVRTLLSEHPALANAAWDWGFGDWETPIGAAAHTGRREIAQLLIDHGARADIFAAAMLGWLDVVKALVAARPGIQRGLGPHGITLLQHARAGGEQSAGVAEFLGSLGDADTPTPTVLLPPEHVDGYVGEYSLAGSATDHLVVRRTKSRGDADEATPTLEVLASIAGVASDPRRLFHVGDHRFFPAGAPLVRIEFRWDGERATSLEIIDHVRLATGTRRV